MIRTRLFRCGVGLLLTFCCFNPVALWAQQPPPPSVLLEFNAGEAGQIGASVLNPGPGPGTTDLVAFFQGRLFQPIALAMRLAPVIEPLYDEQEFPNGPQRVTVSYTEVTLPTGVTIIPGFIGSFLPARLGASLTAEQFLASYLADYILEVNGVRFMDSDLLTPANVASLGPVNNTLFPTLPPGDFYIWGLNVTMRLDTPGTYRIRNIMRIPKTILIPELNAAFLAGEFINEITVRIVPPSSAGAAMLKPTEGPVTVGALPTIDEVLAR